ncbi:(2Fe-2S) ferredoxin domain-containing protein [Streptomonospora wellingtoniae]|uniref:(2Fe-2S) ferredoxin domain-containing protein n=1 Tax=Streptomonospora wellingtoniae TaxID=3075544 RepID=A0ABU2KPL6_9ACTN|nr:(2Fe-2S) ferredoxin domain-containing protein [Streptomonospora sp. DSM 45055]MDT0301217.1 (2Fe-2S) ferredoxin domain-containing protein [Streptomonospora sp. DSM 45055]
MTPTGRPCRLIVCRGCCCGTTEKRPGVDHEGQLKRLSGLRDGAGRDVPVRTSTCLGPCFQANVVVVQPSTEGREGGGRPVWLGEFTEDRLIDDLDDWIRAGGPGTAALPESLAERVTSKDAKKPKKPKKSKKAKKDKKDKQAKKAEKDGKAKARKVKDKKGKAKGSRGEAAGTDRAAAPVDAESGTEDEKPARDGQAKKAKKAKKSKKAKR